MAFLTESELGRRHNIPIALSLTRVKQGDWLLLTSIRLQAGMALSYRWLQLQLVDVLITPGTTPANADPCAVVEPTLINPALGYAYVAIFKAFNVNAAPATLAYTGTGADIVIATGTGIFTRDVAKPPLELTEAADYSWVLVNNCVNADLRLAVTGMVTAKV
jgi:hypothetical protein